MDITTILYTTFISIVGLQMCVPDGDVEKMADKMPSFWCPNPFLRIIYGLLQLLSALFVLGLALYLTFDSHWWYILVFIGGVILGKIVAFLLQIPMALLFSKQIEGAMYGGLIAKRITGSILIVVGMGLFLIQL